MATFWQKTLFYLGLVDADNDNDNGADQGGPAPVPSQVPGEAPRVVTARPPGSVAGRRVDPPSSANPQQIDGVRDSSVCHRISSPPYGENRSCYLSATAHNRWDRYGYLHQPGELP